MTKRIFTLLALILWASTSLAQTSREEVMADINRAGGVYYGYTAPTAEYTPSPKGYEPFYISHYGRHGSRYMGKDSQYDYPVSVLNKAHAAGKLTPLGEDVRERVLKVYAVAERRGGDLTQKGIRQHEEIATRMAQNFPELFKQKGLKVDVISSVYPRCLMSMAAFCDALKSQNPTLQITRDASNAKMEQIHNLKSEWNPTLSKEILEIVWGENNIWRKRVYDYEREHIDFSRLLGTLFNDREYIRTQFNNRDLWRSLAEFALNIQCIDIEDVCLYDIFTKDELYEYWRTGNFAHYAKFGHYIYFHTISTETSKILKAIIAQIDKDLAAGTPSVSLRFGHDTCIFAISPFMGFPGSCAVSTDYDVINNEWRNYRIAPMAANIQMIFYRKKGCDDVLVRILHNEEEVRFDIESPTAPYYRWEDVKHLWLENIRKATQY
ncbi:MAG: histidine-type phosphatase [Alistipes sp.]|nr:histidine-type phosphatase [Alistipes sp.]